MNVLINGNDVSTLPGMLLIALGQGGNMAATQFKSPALLKDKENMRDVLEVMTKRLDREIENDFERRS